MLSSVFGSKITPWRSPTDGDHPLPEWPIFPPGRRLACFRPTRLSGCWRSTGSTWRRNITKAHPGGPIPPRCRGQRDQRRSVEYLERRHGRLRCAAVRNGLRAPPPLRHIRGLDQSPSSDAPHARSRLGDGDHLSKNVGSAEFAHLRIDPCLLN